MGEETRRGWGPAALGAAALLLTAATIVLDLRNGTNAPADAQLDEGWTSALSGLAQVVPGVLLLHRLPRHPIAWILTGSGLLWVVDGLASSWATYSIYTSPGLPGGSAAYWFYSRFGAFLLLGLPLLILLFPDGKLVTARVWRWLSIVSLALTLLLPVLLLVAPMDVMQRYHSAELPPEITRLALDPFSIDAPYDVWAGLLRVAYAGVIVSLVVPFAVAVHRYRAATRESRAQLRWLMWAALVDMIVLIVPFENPPAVPAIMFGLAIAVTSAAIVVAVAKHRLYDIDRLLSATFLYGVLAVLVVGIDLAVFAIAGGMLGERDAALVAIAVVAVVYAPLRSRLWRWVRRLVRGSRDDPYATMSTLAERLESAADPDQQLHAVARTVADAFRLPYVRVEIERSGGGLAIVEHGRASGPTHALPVGYRGEPVGRLVFCPGDGTALSERDQRLLGDLVRQAAAAARATELSTELQRSRSRLVAAREEERRRIRRDLHDGLGPSLGAVTLRIETARNLAKSAPDEADRILVQATTEMAAAVADVRRLVHDLRPPALDELGLVRAIQQQAEPFRLAGLAVSVDADPLGTLPAGVEVAAYRIASEALTNVARHAAASRCDIALRLDEAALELSVQDDGIGIGEDVAAGVGMLSVRERVAELGGVCSVTCPPSGGTAVHVRLPLDAVPEVAHG
ncbi:MULTISPECIES: sensor histidine kinase [Kribbella]|uniref:Oxygen sensor histidine kinase NreB n=1 Tax=Kribbella pratensis TaxID=2512112 RepID=A0ABY2FIV4_9ACTN|nr:MULTISPECIES: sensor histidine kinase [Kribbella]TDW92004.1 histidine kinase/DNA gyrase B/HSP90-like ATPase [Kribbella sp. VKM Ac-2566]TDW93050.1 histidine kinase/DNA gyrase B/HSP90-like ATPase [Kribbella pratensis]